jgi:hypothetical protein
MITTLHFSPTQDEDTTNRSSSRSDGLSALMHACTHARTRGRMHACHRPAPVHRCLRGRQALTIRPTGLAVDARCGHPALRVACSRKTGDHQKERPSSTSQDGSRGSVCGVGRAAGGAYTATAGPMAHLLADPGPDGIHAPRISEAELEHFREHGYVFLGRCAPLGDVERLGERIDELMLGAGAAYPRMMMSVCPSETGSWEHPATQQTPGFKYPTLGYRKIQGLEEDTIFRAWVQGCLWRDVTRRLIGEQVGINRAMYFAKPARTEGVRIDWHQDNSGDQGIGAVTVWTALDKTTLANGCLQISPGMLPAAMGAHPHLLGPRGFAAPSTQKLGAANSCPKLHPALQDLQRVAPLSS